MEGKDVEKKIYEFLGVNVFRKYILLPWAKLMKLIHLDSMFNYQISDTSINGLKDYKSQSKFAAAGHVLVLIITAIAFPQGVIGWLVNIAFNSYCIMVQRYNHIRINEIIAKLERREKDSKRLNPNSGSIALEKENAVKMPPKELEEEVFIVGTTDLGDLTETKKTNQVGELEDTSDKSQIIYDMIQSLEKIRNTLTSSACQVPFREDNSQSIGGRN
jgi:hypothetical protein